MVMTAHAGQWVGAWAPKTPVNALSIRSRQKKSPKPSRP